LENIATVPVPLETYVPILVFLFCLPVYLSVTHNHFAGIEHSTVCLLCRATTSHTKILSLVVYTIPPLDRYPLLVLALNHRFATSTTLLPTPLSHCPLRHSNTSHHVLYQHSLVHNHINTTLYCTINTTLPLIAGFHVYIRMQNTLHSSRKNSFRCQQSLLEGISNYVHVRPFSHNVAKSRQCRRQGGVTSSRILWQYIW
jgi:hypothetical protein